MPQPLSFSDADQTRFRDFLVDSFPGFTAEKAMQVVDDVQQTGLARAYGYGSLVDSPHTEIDNKVPASLPGWKKGFVCQDTHYRGTTDKPGMTLGLNDSEDPAARTEGAVLESRVRDVDQAIDFFDRLAQREIPPGMDIYTFDFLEVETAKGPIRGMVCVANKLSELYVGDRLDPREKGTLVAERLGDERFDENGEPLNAEKGRRTNFQYVQNAITNDIELGREPDRDMLEVFLEAGRARQAMDADRRRRYEALELPLTDAQRGDVAAAARRADVMSEARLSEALDGMSPLPPPGGPRIGIVAKPALPHQGAKNAAAEWPRAKAPSFPKKP